jgi:hypothetical protein
MTSHRTPPQVWLRGMRAGLTLALTLATVSCTNAPSRPGSGEAGAGAGTNGAAGATTGQPGTAGGNGAAGDTGPAGTGGPGAAGATGLAGAGAAGTTGGGAGTTTADAAVDTAGSGAAGAGATDGGIISPPFDAAGRTQPTCVTPKPNPNPASRSSECDYLLQSIDFESKYSYATTPADIKLTSFGTALGLSAINNCGPYCYGDALTVGVDIVGGGDVKATQGEIIVEFPATGPGLPIANAVGRASLGWMMLDGPTAPPFAITGQMIYETSNGIVSAKGQTLAYNNWLDYTHAEFKYFNVGATTFSAPPVNVTGIGFRITSPANLPKGMEWHGVAYIDHLQIRDGAAGDNPNVAGGYPFGL